MNAPTAAPTAAQTAELTARRAAEDAAHALIAADELARTARTPAAYAASAAAFERWHWAARKASALAALLPPTPMNTPSTPMNTPSTPMNTPSTPDNLAPYYAFLTLVTRSHGSCYVHAGRRANYTGADGTLYTVSGYGRSLTTKNGHKYKVHARTPDGKPTPTRDLQDLIRRAVSA